MAVQAAAGAAGAGAGGSSAAGGSAAGGSAAGGSAAGGSGWSSIMGSGMYSLGNIGTGALMGSLMGKQDNNKELERNRRRMREIYNAWGLPVTKMASGQALYTGLTGRYPTPTAERQRQQVVGTAAGMMQNDVRPGMPGYQEAVRKAAGGAKVQEKKVTIQDLLGVLSAMAAFTRKED